MSTNDLVMKVEKLKELEELLEEVKAEAESVRDEIKQEMLTQDTEELEAGQYMQSSFTPRLTSMRLESRKKLCVHQRLYVAGSTPICKNYVKKKVSLNTMTIFLRHLRPKARK